MEQTAPSPAEAGQPQLSLKEIGQQKRREVMEDAKKRAQEAGDGSIPIWNRIKETGKKIQEKVAQKGESGLNLLAAMTTKEGRDLAATETQNAIRGKYNEKKDLAMDQMQGWVKELRGGFDQATMPITEKARGMRESFVSSFKRGAQLGIRTVDFFGRQGEALILDMKSGWEGVRGEVARVQLERADNKLAKRQSEAMKALERSNKAWLKKQEIDTKHNDLRLAAVSLRSGQVPER